MSEEIPAEAVRHTVQAACIEPADWTDPDGKGLRQVYSTTTPLDDYRPVTVVFMDDTAAYYPAHEMVLVFRVPLPELERQSWIATMRRAFR